MYIYDDGSAIATDGTGEVWSRPADANTWENDPAPAPAGYSVFSTDAREAAKLDAFIARPQGDNRPWWERVAEFGLSRAIDAHYGPAAVNKTGAPGTYAGQNGKTYVNGQGQGAAGGGFGLLLLGGLALLALS